jgi:orotate phosphoribosyltransferase
VSDVTRDRLLDLICERALKKGEFVLSSGERSNYYIDGKMIASTPEGATLIGQVLFQELRRRPEIRAIGGLEVGAVPLVTATLCVGHYEDEGRRIEGFWVRNKPKQHGTMKLIEGWHPQPVPVAIVDDVITSGNSVLKAIEAVEEAGATVAVVLALVDRDGAARERLKGYDYCPIFTKDDLLSHDYAEHSV